MNASGGISKATWLGMRLFLLEKVFHGKRKDRYQGFARRQIPDIDLIILRKPIRKFWKSMISSYTAIFP